MKIPITFIDDEQEIWVDRYNWCPLCWSEQTPLCNNGGCDE